MKVIDIILIIVILAALTGAVMVCWKNRGKGCSGCCGSCPGCAGCSGDNKKCCGK